MSAPGEHTSGREAARKALIESQRNRRRSDSVVSDSRATLDRLRAINERPDKLADSLRMIIQGAQ